MAPFWTNRPRSNAIMKPKLRGLQDLPAEVLAQIFKYVLDEEWTGFMPNLIKALRPNAYLYKEALTIWHGLEPCYILSKENNWQFKGMSMKAVLAIKKLKIVVE
jgi:hypothetical protein